MLGNKTISATKKLHTTTSITFLTHRGLHKTLPTPFAYTKEHILYHDRDNDGESFHLPRPIIVPFDPKMLFADYDPQRTYRWPTSCYPMKTHNPKHISSQSQQRKKHLLHVHKVYFSIHKYWYPKSWLFCLLRLNINIYSSLLFISTNTENLDWIERIKYNYHVL